MSENLPPVPSPPSTPVSEQKKRSALYWAVLFFSPTICVVPPVVGFFGMLLIGLDSTHAQSSTLGWTDSTMVSLVYILILVWAVVFGIVALFGPVSCSYAIVKRLSVNPFAEIVLGVGTWGGILLVNGVLITALGLAACQGVLGF